jgi:hypothetical protein
MDFKKSTIADLSLKVYPQLGQQRRSHFFEKGHPEVHFISLSTNSFPQRGHLSKSNVAISGTPFKNQNIKVPACGRQTNVKGVSKF